MFCYIKENAPTVAGIDRLQPIELTVMSLQRVDSVETRILYSVEISDD